MKSSNLIVLLLTSVLIAGCGTSGGGFKYIVPSKQDRLTDGTAKQILEHNEFCEKQGNCVDPRK